MNCQRKWTLNSGHLSYFSQGVICMLKRCSDSIHDSDSEWTKPIGLKDLIRPWHPRFSDAIDDAPSYACPRMFSIGIASKPRISVSLSAIASPEVLSIFAKSMNSYLMMAGCSLLSRNLRHSTKTSNFFICILVSYDIGYDGIKKTLPYKPFRILPVIWFPMIWITSCWMVFVVYKAFFFAVCRWKQRCSSCFANSCSIAS